LGSFLNRRNTPSATAALFAKTHPGRLLTPHYVTASTGVSAKKRTQPGAFI
jgi:hypothetical protein